jgi:hypothetical protein
MIAVDVEPTRGREFADNRRLGEVERLADERGDNRSAQGLDPLGYGANILVVDQSNPIFLAAMESAEVGALAFPDADLDKRPRHPHVILAREQKIPGRLGLGHEKTLHISEFLLVALQLTRHLALLFADAKHHAI